MEIILGAISAVIIFIVRENYLKAQRQKEIASLLSGYIDHWRLKLTKDDGLFNITYFGIEWQIETTKHIRSGADASDILKLDEEYEKKLTKLFKYIDERYEEMDEAVKSIIRKLEKNSELKNEFIIQLKDYKSSLINGKMFISDHDAAKLGHGYAFACVNLKSHLISLIDNAIYFTLTYEAKNLEYDEYKHMLQLILKDWIYASKEMEFLSTTLKRFNK